MLAMRKRLTSFALVLVVAGSVYAGMPLHSSEQECNMPGMAGMDCCKKAAKPASVAAEDLLARLCCAINCSQEGSTAPQGTQLPRPSVEQLVRNHSSWHQAQETTPFSAPGVSWAHSPPPYSNPAYIRHLALLI